MSQGPDVRNDRLIRDIDRRLCDFYPLFSKNVAEIPAITSRFQIRKGSKREMVYYPDE